MSSVYRLTNEFTSRHYVVTVVGCGGTGGFVAESLCRILPANAGLVLVDHDQVEERNLTRQAFYREDLGQFKSEVLAHRLARRFGRPVAYSTLPVAMREIHLPGLVIGCVDNGLARRDIARSSGDFCSWRSWWVDAGNGENYGQVVIGNTDTASLWLPDGDIYRGLPLPTTQKPGLLAQAPRARDCAAIAEEQGPTINTTMAAVVAEVVRRLIAGTCPWVQLYLDMEAGTLVPVLATPETVKSLSKRKGGKP
jgi:hypothetical protein